jgi:hypothetical protein
MAKKKARRPGGAAGMAVVEDETDDATIEAAHESNGIQSDPEMSAVKTGRKTKVKPDHQPSEHFGIGDIKKAAAFANSIGGLDKAIAVLQILKVAKEVQ